MPAVRPVILAGGLRGAIVNMVILGPCKAMEPKDPSQIG
jgi:hypothetical protein